MSTSGSVDFSTSRDSLIKYALKNIGVIAEGVTPSATQVTECAVILNMIVKSWHARMGMPLWALKTGYILPIADTNSMLATSHCVTIYTQTTISAAEAANQTVLSVTSITGISSGYVLGVELDDGTIHWTTVNGAPSGGTVTATVAIPSVASAGNIVYAYSTTNRITRPLRVVNAFSHEVTTNSDVPIQIIAYKDFADLGTKTAESYPTQLYYDPQLIGNFFWYPRFANGDRVINFRYHRPFEDFDSSGDEPDFPQEWYFPLLWYFSWALSPGSAVPLETRNAWRSEANQLIEEVRGMGMEEGSIFFNPSDREMY